MKIGNRKKVLVKCAFWLGWMAIFLGILIFGWTPTWKALLVPSPWTPVFADMRCVQGALTSVAQGLNPQVSNPGDPWNRVMNYPLIWVRIANVFGFNHEINYLIFLSIAVLCFIYCCYKVISETDSVWILFVAFSGSSLLAIERGNNDIIIFSLLYCAACLPVYLMTLLLLIATALKIYPAFVMPALIREKVAAVTFLICSIALMFLMRNELGVIRAGTPVFASLSYGSSSIAAAVEQFLHIKISPLFISIILIASAFVVYLKPLQFLDLQVECTNERVKRLFCFGACIFVGTFLFASNFDYKLIFLLLCVPYVLLIQNGFSRIAILVCMLAATNQRPLYFFLKPFGPVGPVLSVLAKCILFSFLLAMILNLLRAEIHRIRSYSAPRIAETGQPAQA